MTNGVVAPMLPSDRQFYRRWIVANFWAEGVGLGTTLVLAWTAAPSVDEVTSTFVIIVGALGAVALGTLLEGIVVGVAQEGVLRQRLTRLRPRAWVWATALGAGVAWLLGMIPSTVMALSTPAGPATPAAEPRFVVQYGLAVGLGLVLGIILGAAQWIVLRQQTARASRWIWANAAAWSVGMPLVFVGMGLVPWPATAIVAIPIIVLTCCLVGIIVGVIHGRVLVQLVSDVEPAP